LASEPSNADERKWNLPANHLAGWRKSRGVRLVSLQRSTRGDLSTSLSESWRMIDLGKQISGAQDEALMDMASIMKNLDVVITPR